MQHIVYSCLSWVLQAENIVYNNDLANQINIFFKKIELRTFDNNQMNQTLKIINSVENNK